MPRIRVPVAIEHALAKGYQDAIDDVSNCDPIRRRVKSFRDSTAAKEWAKKQDWYPRLVKTAKDVRWFVWWIRRQS